MMNRKSILKKVASLLLVFVFIWTFAGAKYITVAEDDESIKYSDGDGRITVWGGVPPEAGPQQAVEDFNEAFKDKGYEAEYIRFVNDADGNLKLETNLMSGSDVDVYITYGKTELLKRVEGNMALDLTDLAERDDFDIVGTFSDLAESYYINGRPYSIPTKLDQYGIVINKDMFDEAGIEIPKSWTTEEFREIAKQLTHGEGQDKVYGMFWNTQQDINGPYGYIAISKNGGDTLYSEDGLSTDLNNPYNIESVQLVADMMNIDESSPTHVDSTTQKLSQEGMFLTGRSAMTIGPWIVRSIKDLDQYPHDFMTAFAPYPVPGDGERLLEQGGFGDHLSINPKSDNIEAAWEYIKWYSTEGMLPVAGGGRVPIANTYDPEEVTEAFIGEATDLLDVETTKSVLIVPKGNYAVSEYTLKSPEISKILREATEAILRGEISAQEALDEANEKANAILQEALEELDQ